MLEHTGKFQSFDCEQAEPFHDPVDAERRSKRCRALDDSAPYQTPAIQFFDCETLEIAEGTPAPPRPPGRERRVPDDLE